MHFVSYGLLFVTFLTMVIIPKEQALCIFYCEPFSIENVEQFIETIDNVDNVEICYANDIKKPMWLCSRIIVGSNLINYH